ncbi:hypothetical protein C8J56DRAFT_1026449 [Mycena floridula]|nr:hypothetical protein C8J56DRAFT_1026449 [Mycena floridula]
MPSFSLVRRFGKQHKAVINSPVSSGLVEQHFGRTMAESSHSESKIRQQSQAGNFFSGSRANDSHGLMSGLVALSQRVENLSMGNINAPVMSNNQFAMLRVGDIYLEEEIGSYLDVNCVWGTRYKGQITASSTSNMSIWSYRGERAEEKLEKAYQVYASLPRASIPWFPIFHGPERVLYIIAIITMDDTLSETCPTDHSAFDPRIWMAIETNTFIKEDLLDYYKFLFDMMFMCLYHPKPTLPSPLHKTAPFQLSHPEINLPVYSLPTWNNLVFEVNGIDMPVRETGIVLTLLPNMTIRQPTSSMIFLSISWIHKLRKISELRATASWIECAAEPINGWRKDTESPALKNLLETKHFYLFCPRKSAGNIYWSQDEQGQHVIEDSLIQAAFGITVRCDWDTYVYPIPPQCYQILWAIHENCGFDPYSTRAAEYLGLPLVVTDGRVSGLEEYVEDLGYNSESESDSDYVSASGDIKRQLKYINYSVGK